MSRLTLSLALAAVVFLPAAVSAETCNLQISTSCTRPQSGASTCTSTTVNAGSNSCAGQYIVYMILEVPATQATLTGFTNTLGLTQCFDSSLFGTTPAPYSFGLCFGAAALPPGGSYTTTAQVTAANGSTASLLVYGLTAVMDATTGEQKALVYAANDVVAQPTCTPSAFVSPIAQSGSPYNVSWTASLDPNTSYQVDESTTPDFSSNVATRTVNGLSTSFQHAVGTPTLYYYRVRATSCNGAPSPYSSTTLVVIQAEAPPSSAKSVDAVVPYGSTQPVQIKIFVPGRAGKTVLDTGFVAATDKPYLTVTPSSGTIPPQGATLTVTANPSNLPPGGNTGTVTVTATSGVVLTSQAVSVSLVTPVGPGGKTTPSSNTLIIPVVTHVNGDAKQFLSDVRLTNGSGSAINYRLTFTPTQQDATKSSKVTTVPVAGGQTVALNDIAKDFFGFGATGGANDVGFGSLEIRPLETSSTLTYAASRTYANTPAGTFGQFIAAVPFSEFASNFRGAPIPGGPPAPSGPALLSLQQVAQSAKFRTNLGIVEGSGVAASGKIRVLDDQGTVLKEVGYSLLPGEHKQMNGFIALDGGPTNLEDGRIEITVDSPNGAVTAYASVLDNVTTDPLAVMPVQTSKISAARYVLPGMAELNNGAANFHSDVRVYNGGSSSVTVTPTYYPQGNGAPVTAQAFTIGAGQVKAINNVLPSLFNVTASGGSIVLTTAANSSLVSTGRTYTVGTKDGVVDEKNGTFGQFIPGVSPSQGVGAGDRALQVLQLEQSRNFRSNLGLAELSGSPATVRITATLPDSKTSPVIERTLQANEFVQYGRILESMLGAGTNTYNVRISVAVTSGSGRVTAYGSVIDNDTGDPTYVPAQ